MMALTIQERLKDLEAETELSSPVLGSYETDFTQRCASVPSQSHVVKQTFRESVVLL